PNFGALQPVVGVKSYLPAASPPVVNSECFKVAGWFEAHGAPCFIATSTQFALFVPQNGGTTSLGWNYNAVPFPTTAYNLQVNGPALINGVVVPSDSKLKKNITPINSGLDVIRGLNIVSYQYNGKGGFDPNRTYTGVVAENVAKVAPYAVDTIQIKMDTTDTAPTAVLGVKTEAMLYTSINAIKQVDSTVQQQQLSIDSLRNSSGGKMGNACGNTRNPLANNYEIPLNGFNLNFTAPVNSSTSNIFIGNPECSSSKFAGRFNVFADNSRSAGSFNVTSS